MSAIQTVTLPEVRKPFVIGLVWRYEERAPSSNVLRRLAEHDGAWGVVRKSIHGVVQIGQGAPIPGRKPSEFRSLAATVADAHPQPWVGRYALGDGREWLIAVHEERGILPNGDFVGTSEQIDELMEQFGGESEWTQVSGTLDELVDLVRGARKTPPLRDFTASIWRRWTLPALGAAVAGAIGITAVLVHQHNAELEEQARSARIKAFRLQQEAKARAAKLAFPWAREASADAALNACGAAWESQDFARNGWMLSKWNCATFNGETRIEKTWRRAGGVASDAPGRLDDDGEHSVESTDGLKLPASSAGAALPAEEARRAVWTFAQRLGLTLTWEAPITPQLPGATAASPEPQPWSTSGVTFDSVAPPWLLGASFDDVPGLRVRALSLDLQTQTWKVKAVVFTAANAIASTRKVGA
ncbi:type 4b pilus protein PilO2 [Burkholderia multivorans]|uniref:Type 4b pilus protein PilO2 n=1 Tax=Burkholderia multivorans TaxID=87883 RepID=A0AAP2HQ76_9BURK|nr:type 4b pilus protein PilO2 [Burkholderia multivorans]